MTPSWFERALAAIALLATAQRASADPVTSNTTKSQGSSWKGLGCGSDFFGTLFRSPSDSVWKSLSADEAWEDIVRNWKDTDKLNGLSFTASVLQTIQPPSQFGCSNWAKLSSCQGATLLCSGTFNSSLSGPAGVLIWNSFVAINTFYKDYIQALYETGFEENDLSPFWGSPPEPKTWASFVADLVTIGTPMTFGAFLKGNLDFISRDATNATMTFLRPSQTIVQEVLRNTNKHGLAPTQEIKLGKYLRGQAFDAWDKMTSIGLHTLFNGADDSVQMLADIITGGQLITGPHDSLGLRRPLSEHWGKLFLSRMIPRVWRESGANAFILDSESSCDQVDLKSLSRYVDNDTMEATGTCYEGRQYYLLQPTGPSQKGSFSAPRGLDWLKGNLYQGMTKRDFMIGSVNTYAANGNKNGGSIDLTDTETLRGLINIDLMVPGLINLPVCSLEQAQNARRTSKPGSNANFPCDAPSGKDN